MIILFYKYVHLPYPERFQKEQRRLCKELGLRGRILLAHEGINGTLGGPQASIDAYMEYMNEHSYFHSIDFKTSSGSHHDFPRLQVSIKQEIVHLGCDPDAITCDMGGTHLSPQQAHELMKNPPNDLVILDTRNVYETRIGTFVHECTHIPQTETFREFPVYIQRNIDHFKDKTVLMACTGGIRCERASAYLQSLKAARKVYQITGGIHRYVEMYPNGFFRGKNYVFDARGALAVTDDVLTHCDLCCQPCDTYTNCINAPCNNHFIACTSCRDTYHNTCCDRCYYDVREGRTRIRTKPLSQPGAHT